VADVEAKGEFATRIAKALNAVQRTEVPRDYIGASVGGYACSRMLFYIRERVATSSPKARVLRIFDFGNSIETLAVKWLRDAGFYVYDTDPRTGDQFKVTGEYLSGHGDGVISNVPLLPDLYVRRANPIIRALEIKSHKAARYADVSDLGVKHSKFEHYAQIQSYLDNSDQMLSAFGIKGKIDTGLYVAINKDTCEVYLEEVAFDSEVCDSINDRAKFVQGAPSPPPRLADSKTKSPCKYCDYKVHCFKDNRTPTFP
jgi:hypothetical protein